MHFMLGDGGWYCQFLREDLKRPLRRKFTFQDASKVEELAERGGAFKNLADRQGFEHGISMGRGAVWLNLTDEQMRKLI